MTKYAAVLVSAALLCAAGCGSGDAGSTAGAIDGFRTGRGVDAANRVVHVGALVDLSGPASSVGRPFMLGQRIYVERVNSGEHGLLPEGWRIELVERDHGYNPQRSVQSYNELRDEVLYLAMSFGTPTTLPIRPLLERDRTVAFPASLSSPMTENRYTPMAWATYRLEAMRALDFAVERAGSPDAVRAAIVYQQDDFGQDGLEGWREAAKVHGVEIVSEQAISPGQGDFTATVSTLRSRNANFVMISSLPSATTGLAGTARTLGYEPVWLGNTPSWGEELFDSAVIPADALANYYLATSFPYWGEDVPGMAEFLADFERYGNGAKRDFYIMLAYIATATGIEATRIAIDSGDVTPDGYLAALASIKDWNVHGMLRESVALGEVPYQTATSVRVLQPAFAEQTWTVASDYAVPRALTGNAR